MTALRLHFRVWATGPLAPAAAGLAALIVAAAILTVAASIRTGIPVVNVLGVMLLVLALGGSYITTLMLSPRPRPAVVARAAVPVVAPSPAAPGTGVPRPATGAGRGTSRPAAARPPTLAAAGPTLLTATVPLGGTP